ncbi:Putative ribonuclease H protein At1g65750 [Linum grandiflorum]
MMKAKYFKHTTVLEAELGYRPSFIWCRLMSAQDFLWKGLRWRIGNDGSVRIWGDRWVPSIPQLFIPSAPMVLAPDALVRELVDPISEHWNADVIESCFPTATTYAIQQIPLRGNGETDCLIWHGSKDGRYSTREEYRFWITTLGSSADWTCMWALQLPPKVKQFIWRFMQTALPTGVQMTKRSRKAGDQCPFCGLKESQLHLFG